MAISILSLFDEEVGQVALISNGIDEKKADEICTKIAVSVMANITILKKSEEIVGDSIIPLIEDNIIALVYYFFIKADNLRNNSFSLVLYCVPLDRREDIYANVSKIVPKLEYIADRIKREVSIVLPAKDNTKISINVQKDLKELCLPLEDLLQDEFNAPSRKLIENLNFIENVAFTVFNNSDISVNVIFSDKVEEKIIKKQTLRITYGLLMEISEGKKEGEAIIPVIDKNQIVFTYFFPLKEKTGIFQLLVENKNRMMIYRWATMFSKHLRNLANEFRKHEISVILPEELERKIRELYFFDTFAYEDIYQKSGKPTVTKKFDFSQKLVKIKSFEKVLYALMVGKTLVITDCTLDKVEDCVEFFNTLLPHRNIEYEVKQTFLEEDMKDNKIFYIIDQKIPKNIIKEVTLIEFNKNKVKSKLNNNYIHHLGRKIKNKNQDQISSIIHDELAIALDEVSKLIEHARMDDKSESKKLIREQMLNLPLKSLFDLINDLATYYNPILSDVIEKFAINLTLSMMP